MSLPFCSLSKSPFGKFNWTGRKFTATTSENVQDKPVEGDKMSEMEKKLKADIDNLNKELESLSQKADNLEVNCLLFIAQ